MYAVPLPDRHLMQGRQWTAIFFYINQKAPTPNLKTKKLKQTIKFSEVILCYFCISVIFFYSLQSVNELKCNFNLKKLAPPLIRSPWDAPAHNVCLEISMLVMLMMSALNSACWHNRRIKH